MSFMTQRFRKRSGLTSKIHGIKKKLRAARGRPLGMAIIALRRVIDHDASVIVRIDGRRVAVLSLLHYPHLERFLEQEEEKKLDRIDIEEAERRLSDPTQVPIPFEQALREIELGRLSG